MVVKMTLKDRVFDVIADCLPDVLRSVEIDENDRLDDLGLYYIDILDLATRLEDVFDQIVLTETEIDAWRTARDVFESVERQMAERGM